MYACIHRLCARFLRAVCRLCKTLLDPFGNRRVSNADFQADVQIDVLIAETNAGLNFWPERVEALKKREATARAWAEAQAATHLPD